MVFTRFAAAWVMVGLLACDFFSTSGFVPDPEPKPERIIPEIDAFKLTSTPSFLWKEGPSLLSLDSAPVQRKISVLYRGDSLRVQTTIRLVEFVVEDGNPLPAGLVSSLGWRKHRIGLDSLKVVDPGVDAQWPEIPKEGWRAETVSGLFLHVREFKGSQLLTLVSGVADSWVFSDTLFWNGVAMQIGQYWFGNRGLLKSRIIWPNYQNGAEINLGGWSREVTLI